MSAATEVEVPEPSPLFWDHFSARVRQAVSAQGVPVGSRLGWWSLRPAMPVPLFAFTLVVLTLVLTMGAGTPRDAAMPASMSIHAAVQSAPTGDEALAVADDPSVALVAALAADMDWDGVSEAGLTTRIGADSDAVNQLTDDERGEQQQLLKRELGSSGT